MSGRRTRRLLREDLERTYYRLSHFLGGYLHQDWPVLYGSPEHAVEAAIAEHPVKHRREARRELHSLLAKLKNDRDLRDALIQGLGVNVYFRKPHEARKLLRKSNRSC